jgi:nitrous oxidase accessory protein NosD
MAALGMDGDRRNLLLIGIAAGILTLAPAADARTVTVKPGESIQAAVDAATPGSTIMVLPGVYHEPGNDRAVTITRDDIHLVARAGHGDDVVIEASGGQTDGVWVSPVDTVGTTEDERPPCGTSGARLHGFRMQGFTVRGFSRFGVYLACADDFSVTRTTSTDNGEYAIFPVASRHGRLSHDVGARTRSDACLYVGEDEDVVVDHSTATDCQIGFEIENSRHVVMRQNLARANTAGIIVDVINDRLTTVCADNRVEGNVFDANNRASSALPTDDTADLQPGIGIIIDGADRTRVAHNTIRGHTLAGLTLVDFCLDRPDICAMPGLPIDPRPDDNRILANTFEANANQVFFFPNGGTGNCFSHNRPSDLGSGLPACH